MVERDKLEKRLRSSGKLRAPGPKVPQKQSEPLVKEIKNDDDEERTKTENQDEIRESHLDGEGVLVGNE